MAEFKREPSNCGPCCKKRREVALIMRSNRLHRSALEKKLKAFGLHRSQHMLLMVISHERESVSQKELAERLQITPAAVTMSLKKLEQGGYITRRTSECDNRVNEINITEKGAMVIETSREHASCVDNAMFNGISESELEVFIKVMERVNENILALGAED